ncbi:MAG: nitroreductase family protein [Calothrix sp. SM1_5_4]|nr:nitroreductase family protein [Calothrix sp. SM1_5_4]
MHDQEKSQPRFVEIPQYPKPTDPVAVSEEFYETIRMRRSIRHFSNLPVERDVVLNAIRAAGTAPSGANCQPWFFALIESQALKEKIREDAEKVEGLFYSERASDNCLRDLAPLGTSATKPYLSAAPALIAVFTRRAGESANQRIYYPIESTGIAVGLLLTAIHQAGLASLTHTPRPLNFLNEILGLDRSYSPFMLVVAGHPQEPILVPDIQRKPLSEICSVY